MQHILILSKDEEYRNALLSLLKDAGYTVYPSDTIKDTVDQFYSKKLDLIIVDVESWKEEGIKTYRDLRHELGTKDFSSIIIVPMDLMENVEFSLAFDDFIIKDGNPKEVPLRIRQLLWRKSRLDTENIIKIDDLILDLNSYEVAVKGKRVYLTYKEYELLKFLVLNRGRVFTRDVLLDKVWGYDNYAGTRTVDIHVQRLRTKLWGGSSSLIQTVRNVGYCFVSEKAETY
jgi:two-component system alkaline phosphatase synthesis response regulator PhoP